jgi:hypothetical protein
MRSKQTTQKDDSSWHYCTAAMIANSFVVSMVYLDGRKKAPQNQLPSITFYASMKNSVHD